MNALAEPPNPKEKPSESELITGLQHTVSASRLTLFLQCRLKFYYRYVLNLQKPKSPSLHVGNTVHTVLKAWNKARWLEQPLTLKGAHDVFTQAWSDQAREPVQWDGDEPDQQSTAWRLCETYLREAHVPATLKPDAVEVSVETELKQHGLPRLVGVLDLVQQRQIIDYKTSSTTPQPDKVAHTHEVQTSSYAVLYREATGQREAGLQLHHLVKLKNPRVVVTALPPMSDPQQSRLFHLMGAYVTGLERRDFVPSPGMQCHSCEFFKECHTWR
jgi:CRISPR/Cas system-associated exonuclease Cas4 (RecB family)